MARMTLSEEQISAYERDGFLSPIPVLSRSEVDSYALRLEERIPAILGDPEENKRMQYKAHLLYTWLDALVHHSAILDAVESLLGPDILVWNSGFLVKPPRDPSFVSWHQDATYWGLEPMEVVSAWVALTDSTSENGCVRCLPGSHRLAQIPHRDSFAKNNMLSRGQAIQLDIDESQAVFLQLGAGEMSLHHVRTIHGSEPNRSDTYRIGFIINYISARVRQKSGSDSAMLVRGEDRFGHFEPDPRPATDRDECAILAHERAVRRQLANILS
jgi:non-heme Fe2+,alpha-ketoglutarate-dependent halogenase